MKKDVKKSSYYVWFLGAQECKNVRDVDSIVPVISALADREKKVAPHKFTLQVSHRGLKIVHNVSALTSLPPGGKSSKSDLVKHLIPDHSVTCVHRDEDLVAVILLLYNPVTKWPVHVHVYRCDSVETATLLSGQLQMLIDRPENRKKLDEMEARLQQTVAATAKEARGSSSGRSGGGGERKRDSPPSSSSESGGVPVGGGAGGHMTTLYDSLAAELKKKLGTGGGKSGGAPILLPPRDYDTVHRHRGNLNGIDFRRCMSTNIVGVNGTKQQEFRRSGGGTTKMGSSGGSSGIGSDHAPSPEQYEPESRYADNNSSSDEDWNASPLEEPLFAKTSNDPHQPLSRIRRQDSGVESGSSPVTWPEKNYYGRPEQQQQQHANFKRQQSRDIAQNLRDKYSDRNVALVQPRPRNSNNNCDATPKTSNSGASTPAAEFRRKPVEVRQRTPSPSRSLIRESPRERFKDAKEKFLMLEKERIDEQRSALKKCLDRQRKENASGSAIIRSAVRGSCDWSCRSRDSDDEETDRVGRNGYVDDDFDDFKGSKNVGRRSNNHRSRESLDNDYSGGYPTKQQPVSNSRRSRNSQQDYDEPRPAPRCYSAEDYSSRDFSSIPSPPEDRYKSPQRRTTAAVQQAEAPRVAPRRSNHFNDAPPPQPVASSRANDHHKRRSTAYAYEDCGEDCCSPPPPRSPPPPNFGKHETLSLSAADDDGRPPHQSGREYKRRSAAYAYEDHHHPRQDLGGRDYGRRDMMHADNRDDHRGDSAVASPVSPRYRHSYAEAYHSNRHHHHHQQQQQPQRRQHSPSPQDRHPVYRHNGSLQPSGRIGIAAIHPY